MTQYGYNAFGNVATITDPLGRSVGFTYDGANRMTSQTLPDGRSVGYSYDANGNVTSITPPGRPAHRFTFTALDKEASYLPPAIDASDPSTTYAYNLDRDLIAITRPGGERADYSYDLAGKLTGITTPTATYAYTYGVNGCASCGGGTKPESVTRNGETLTYAYDGSLLLSTTSSGTVNGSVGWTYDNEFRVTSQTINGADAIAYTYDTEGLLKSVGQLTLNRTATTGFLSGTTLGSVTTSYAYNTYGETTRYGAKIGATSAYDVQYTRDGAGRIAAKAETVNGVTTTYDYGYDVAGRLTTVSENGAQTASYTYDSNGNRIIGDERGTVSQGYYDLQDRLTKYGATTYTYTPNGELKTKTDASGTTTYIYDFYGNLTSVTLPDGTQIAYVIDGQNRRVGKKINGTLVQGWLYRDQLNPVAEVDATGAIVARFVYGDKGNIPSYVTKNGVTYRIVSDHLGSPRAIIDTATNTVVQTYQHDAFGSEATFTDPNGLGRLIPFGFAGGIYDEQTGLTRFGARDYDPVSGRWTSKDPIGFEGGVMSLYGYVNNDPVDLDDPSGLSAWNCVECYQKAPIFAKACDECNKELGGGGVSDWVKFLKKYDCQTGDVGDCKRKCIAQKLKDGGGGGMPADCFKCVTNPPRPK